MDRFIFDLTKLLLYIMSIFTIILAVTILVLSLITLQRTASNNRQKYAPDKSIIITDFYFLISVCMIGSLSTLLISFYGINAVYHELTLFLCIHALLLLLIHSCSLLIGSAIYFDERQIGGPASLFFKAHYNYASLVYSTNPSHNASLTINDIYLYGKSSPKLDIIFDTILDNVHQRLQCCGLMGTSDFAEMHVPVPYSCFDTKGVSYQASCLFKFRLESVHKAQTFAICIFILGVLTLVSFLIDLILIKEFLQDQLLEKIIEKLSNFSNVIEPINQIKAPQSRVQQLVMDYLLENTD